MKTKQEVKEALLKRLDEPVDKWLRRIKREHNRLIGDNRAPDRFSPPLEKGLDEIDVITMPTTDEVLGEWDDERGKIIYD